MVYRVLWSVVVDPSEGDTWEADTDPTTGMEEEASLTDFTGDQCEDLDTGE